MGRIRQTLAMPKLANSIILFLILLVPLWSQAQEADIRSAEEIWQHRQRLQHQLINELRPIVKKCRADGQKQAAQQLTRLIISRDPQRQYVFLPPENKVGVPRVDGFPEKLQGRVIEILDGHAERLFKFAGELASQESGCAAIENLNEVLFFSPDHAAARNALGHRVIEVEGEKTWRVKSDRLRIKPATKPHPDFNWPAKHYLAVSTTHFQIASKADEDQTLHLAKQLELWHDVWRQVFFSYVDRAKNVERRMQGKSKPGNRNRKYKIVFFADKQDYVTTLSRVVPGIEVSTGYYDDQQKTSYFYADDDRSIEDTWRHELTHQLFQESRRSVASPFENEHLWLGEGIAMYFESLVDHGDYAVVGGFDARRLQYARLRRLKERFLMPLSDLATASKKQFQSVDDLAKVYSQSAGMTHYLMDSNFGSMREPLIEFLRLSYQGKLKKGSFEKLIGKSFDEIENQYDQFLIVNPATLLGLESAQSRTELCLTGVKLADESLKVLKGCENLRWLDLSACDVRGARLVPLSECDSLQQLFLKGAVLDSSAIDAIADLKIVELDLSATDLTDGGLKKIMTGASQLQGLNVAGTKVTSEGVKAFASQRTEVKMVSDFGQQ